MAATGSPIAVPAGEFSAMLLSMSVASGISSPSASRNMGAVFMYGCLRTVWVDTASAVFSVSALSPSM